MPDINTIPTESAETIQTGNSSNEELTAVQQELSELKELQFQSLVKELDIDNNYLELINSQIDKTKKITEIKTDLNNLVTKYPKFKNIVPVTGGVVAKKTETTKTTETKKTTNQNYGGLNLHNLKIQMKEGK